MTKDEAIKWAKGAAALAQKLHMTTSAVCQWSEVPLLQQYRLEALSGGALRVNDPMMPARAEPESALPESCTAA